MFLRNCWYVAAWDAEVGEGLKPVRILGEDIVLYRKTDGVVAALEDACPHRKLPLSMGRIKGHGGMRLSRADVRQYGHLHPRARGGKDTACGVRAFLSDCRALRLAVGLDG